MWATSQEPIQYISDWREPNQWGDKHDLSAAMLEAVLQGASDIYFHAGNPLLCKIDGRLQQLTTRRLVQSDVMNVLQYACGSGTLSSQLEQGKEVATSYSILHPTERDAAGERLRYRFRVNAVRGELRNSPNAQIVMRSIRSEPYKAHEIALEEDLLAAMTPETGCVWITGATGSGKSSTISAVFDRILTTEHPIIHGNILTLERPIEYVYDNVVSKHSVIHQSEVGRDIPSFAEGISAYMRMDPSLILVGETRDELTAAACLQAANTGHLTMSTLHTNECASIPSRLLSFFPPELRSTMMFEIIDTARVLVNQRLVAHASGRGRVALREYLILDEEMRNHLILKSSPERLTGDLRELVRRCGRTFLQSAQLAHAADRISTQTLEDCRRRYGR
ncbi:type IV pilus twitching motility protein PilT [Cupriavidus sp. TMH.W2]|uniref:type IV pilus twitching motility protein PilT n=1 Tax=Cupriavidus sp. TMH.W2 TaxID=3434465 RepID=UPI003D77E0B2